MQNKLRKSFACLVALLLALTLGLTGCGTTANSASTTSDSSNSAMATTAKGLFGKPWVISVEAGNLPASAPAAKDDLYTHYAYGWLSQNQDCQTYTMAASEGSNELQESVLALIDDESKQSHELDQLRILYNQVKDRETISKTGLSAIQPYIDRVQAASSIEDVNALLAAQDYPFSPFILAYVGSLDTRKDSVVTISPNFLCSDALMYGGEQYQDSADKKQSESRLQTLKDQGLRMLARLFVVNKSEAEIQALLDKVIAFEKSYGQYAESVSSYMSSEYGFYATCQAESEYTLDQVCALCPRFPLKATLDKCGLGETNRCSVVCAEWLSKLNEVWTDENLETIKAIVLSKLLVELEPFYEVPATHEDMQSLGVEVQDGQDLAWDACDRLTTLDHVIAKLYVYDVLGTNAKDRLTELSERLIATYKDSMQKTPWTSAESKARIEEKLEHMSLNILEPHRGFEDFSGIMLIPSDEGGTALSNYLLLKQFRSVSNAHMVNQPSYVDGAWQAFEATTVNAFYDPVSNSINILPGMINSFVYSDEMSDVDVLARLGVTIGHEISHGFDYTGAQMGAYGQAETVLVDNDVQKFVERTKKISDYYGSIEIEPGVKVDGQLVVGESAADLSGMEAALQIASTTENFDYERFFAGFAQFFETIMPEGWAARTALVDYHALPNLRVNVNSQMFDPIYEQLGVKEGDGMYLAPEKRLSIWGENS